MAPASCGILHPDLFIDNFWGNPTASNLIRILENLPEGDYKVKVRKLKPAPDAEVYHSIEAPKGELGYYLKSQGNDDG